MTYKVEMVIYLDGDDGNLDKVALSDAIIECLGSACIDVERITVDDSY